MDAKALKKRLNEARKNREYGHFPEALATLHEINNDFPNEVQYRYLLAATYYESWNEEAAFRYAEEALSIDPNYKEAYELIGDIYDKQNDIAKAIVNYEKAYEIDSQYQYVEEKLIKAYFKVGNYQKAVEVCDHLMGHIPLDNSTAKARALTSVHLGALLRKSYGLIYLKKYQEAIDNFLRGRALDLELGLPIHLSLYRDDDESIFKMYYQLGNTVEADKYRTLLKESHKLSDEDVTVLEADAKKDIIVNRQKYNIPW